MHRIGSNIRGRSALGLAALGLTVALAVSVPETSSAFGTVRIASGLNRPIFATGVEYPGNGDLLYIVEQRGVVKVMVNESLQGASFLDIDSLIPNISGNDERGLLGFALHPDFVNNGEFFVHYSNSASNTVIARYTLDSGNPLDADESSAEIIYTENQPFSNHNGGSIEFSPIDGYLYIGLGDGGSGGDPGNRAQNGSVNLGKILRIDVDGSSPYEIPASNPFVGSGDGFNDEIWTWGWRNPWRFSFDRLTGDMYVADVGQNAWEEVDFEAAGDAGGKNYGWRRMEGLHCFIPNNNCNDGSLTLPILEYPHNSGGGFSISGGYVYRGNAIPSLYGEYFYADFVIPNIWSLTHDGNGGSVVITDRESQLSPSTDGHTVNQIASFGEDANGELLIVDRGGATSGQLFKLIPETADTAQNEIEPLGGLTLALGSQNPFSSDYPIQFQVVLEREAALTVDVLDTNGRKIRTIATGTEAAGVYTYSWDGKADDGQTSPSGVYFLRAVSENQRSTKKVGFLQ